MASPESKGAKDESYLAQPPGDCCKKGSLHTGEPTGSFETIAGFNTYISKPTEGKSNGHVLFYFADVWGMFNNAFLVMDGFADAGYLVLGIDYFHGDSVSKHKDPDFDFMEWVYKYVAIADEGVPRWTAAVKEAYGTPNTKYACTGYCFGGPYVCKEIAPGGNCSVGAFAHPGLLKESHFENLTKPLLMALPAIDPLFPAEARRKGIEIMEKDDKKYHLQEYQGVQHGFGLRCDLEKPYERWAKEHCHKTMIDWFDFWLSQS